MSLLGRSARRRRAGDFPSSALPPRGDVGRIRHLFRFLKPYRVVMALAVVALCISAAAVLAFGHGLRVLIDDGLGSEEIGRLHDALIYMAGMVGLLAAGTFARFYLVSWLGERVVADIRRAVFRRLVGLSPAFFEINKVGSCCRASPPTPPAADDDRPAGVGGAAQPAALPRRQRDAGGDEPDAHGLRGADGAGGGDPHRRARPARAPLLPH